MDKDLYLIDIKNVIHNKTYKKGVCNKNENNECLICSKRIKSKKNKIIDGYYPISGRNYAWICRECFDKYHDKLNIDIYDRKKIELKYNDFFEFLINELNPVIYKNCFIYKLDSLLSIIENCDNLVFKKNINIIVYPIFYIKGCFINKIYKINKHSRIERQLSYIKLKSIIIYYSENKNMWDEFVKKRQTKIFDHQYYLLFEILD